MRIKYGRDYYDGGMAYGIDKSVVFPRKVGDNALSIPLDELPTLNSCPHISVTSWGKDLDIFDIYVYFCGKVYCGLYIEYESGIHFGVPNENKVYVWSMAELEKHLKAGHFVLEGTKYWYGKNMDLLTIFREYFKQSGTDLYLYNAINKRVTIGIFNRGENRYGQKQVWHVDGDDLKNIGFVRVLPVNTAFQELSMWFGGILPKEGEKPVKIVDEKIRIDKRGFDHVTSFRKEPSKKKVKH